MLGGKKRNIMKKAWIVTRKINQYNQDGEYFVGCFDEKPTFKQLKEMLPDQDDVTIGKLTRGGGRQGVEYVWFNLIETEFGKRCDW